MCILNEIKLCETSSIYMAQSAGAVEYTNRISAEG